MAKYKVGDKVKLRADLVVGNEYKDNNGYEDRVSFVYDMGNYRGKEVTIARVNVITYQIEEDNEKWHYTDDMIEHEPKKPEEPLMERKVLPIEHTSKLEIYVEYIIVNDPAIIMFYRVANCDYYSGEFKEWSESKKIVAKCNKESGDKFDIGKGVEVAMLKAYRKEIDKLLRKI